MRKITFLKTMLLAAVLLVGSGNAWAVYSGTGTFAKITSVSDLTDGYYVILNSTEAFAMNSTNAGTYFTHTSVTPSAGTITNPATSIVWEVKSHNDGGRTIFNEVTSRYVSYTGSSNDAQAVAAVTSGNQRWSITYASNVFTVTNVAINTRMLQYNSSSPRFACYTSAQQKLIFYKLQAPTCTASNLAFANPTVSKTTADAPFTVAATSLNATTAITYTSDNTAVATVNATTGEVTVVGAGIAKITATQAAGTHAAVDYCASTAEYTLTVASTTPTITITETSVPAMTAVVGSTDTETIHISGINLTGDIYIAVAPDSQDKVRGKSVQGRVSSEFSASVISITPTDGVVPSTAVTITYAPLAAGSHTAQLSVWSEGSNLVEFTLNGTANWAPLPTPVATDASGVNNAGFTVNWEVVSGATEYDVNVYTKEIAGSISETEAFDNVTPNGNLIGTSSTFLFGWSVNSQSATRQIYTSSGNYGVASPSLALTMTGDFIETKTYSNPINTFSFWAKDQKGSVPSTSYALIEGYNGSEWSTIAILSNADVITASTKNYDLLALGMSNIVKVRIIFTKSDGNMSIDDIVINYKDVTTTPIAGSPFTVTGETSKAVSGLSAETTYYYTVVAKNENVTSPVSNEVSVTTGPTTGVDKTEEALNVRVSGNQILFSASANQTVEVFNAVGQKLMTRQTVDGLNTLAVSARGVVFVKLGDKVTKVIL